LPFKPTAASQDQKPKGLQILRNTVEESHQKVVFTLTSHTCTVQIHPRKHRNFQKEGTLSDQDDDESGDGGGKSGNKKQRTTEERKAQEEGEEDSEVEEVEFDQPPPETEGNGFPGKRGLRGNSRASNSRGGRGTKQRRKAPSSQNSQNKGLMVSVAAPTGGYPVDPNAFMSQILSSNERVMNLVVSQSGGRGVQEGGAREQIQLVQKHQSQLSSLHAEHTKVVVMMKEEHQKAIQAEREMWEAKVEKLQAQNKDQSAQASAYAER